MLRAVASVAREHPLDIVSTFLGAHEVPLEFRTAATSTSICRSTTMIPAVAGEGLAEWCDVFCETGVFTPAESTPDSRSRAGRGTSIPRIHADELGPSGGSRWPPRVRRAFRRSPDLCPRRGRSRPWPMRE